MLEGLLRTRARALAHSRRRIALFLEMPDRRTYADYYEARLNKLASWSVLRALLPHNTNPGSLYRCGESD